MKKIILLFSLLLSTISLFAFSNETLHYTVTYKWGLVQKDAGTATLTLRNNGDSFRVTLTGKTLPWADKFFYVRDTLHSTIAHNEMRPLSYTRIAHEGKSYARDEFRYSHHGTVVGVTGDRVKVNKKGERKESKISFNATAPAYDMLSIFYYLRTLNYGNMKQNSVAQVTMFSGKQKETLRIKYLGKNQVTLRNKTKREAYKIKFTFTENGKKTSDDIECWISTDSQHIPLLVVGNLTIGQIRCHYTGK